MSEFLFGEYGQRFSEADNPWQELGKELTEAGAESPVPILALREDPVRLCVNLNELKNRGGNIPQGFSIHADSFTSWFDVNMKYQLLWVDYSALTEFCNQAILPDHEITTELVNNELCFVSTYQPPETKKPHFVRSFYRCKPGETEKTVLVRDHYRGVDENGEAWEIDEAGNTLYGNAPAIIPDVATPVEKTQLVPIPVEPPKPPASKRLIDYFPFDEPRAGQMATCAEIIDAFQRGFTDVILEAPCGCHGKGTFIRMFNGSRKKVEDIVVGDQLMGPDNTPRNVLELCRGRQLMYRVKPKLGKAIIVNLDHVLSLHYCGKERQFKVVNMTVREWLKQTPFFHSVHKLYRVPLYVSSKGIARIVKNRRAKQMPIKSVTPLFVDDFYGFELDGDHLYLLLDATVCHNSGKSVLAMTVLRYLLAVIANTQSFIATPLKTLQNQYAAEPAFIDYMRVVKGMGAYRCAMSGTFSPRCSSLGSKARANLRRQCKDQGICAYYNALEAAKQFDLVLHNMASLIFQCSPFGFHFSPRDFLCCDEAHTCEDSLLELFSFSISKKVLTKYDVRGTIPWLESTKYEKPSFDEVNAWLDTVKMTLTMYLAANKETMKEADEKQLERTLDNISRYETAMDRWVCDMNDPDAYVFKPLDVSDYAGLISGKGKKRLWMSATILGKDNFAKSMGLDSKKSYFISLPSTFPKQNRPIYACENYGIKSLNAREIDKNMPKLIDAVDDIISHYPNEKGLIHTHTYKILHALVNNSKHKHRFVFHDATNREEVLGDFIRSTEPLILVSPSMIEGIDLKDDLGRFQILCKIPWPYLGDAQIAALKDYREGWYVWKCSLDVVQACGRIVRHEKDWGHTYVVDPDFRRWREMAWDILPKYFKESIVFVK